MAKPADISSKRLISLNPNGWARWVTQQPDLAVQEIISTEFQFVSRENDTLLRVTSPQAGVFLLLNEVQLRYKPQMPRRIRAYSGLAEEKYDLPVYPVLVNILPPASDITIPDRYYSVFQGLEARQDYRVINLWEVDAAAVFTGSLVSLLPLVPVMRGGNDERVIQRALRELRSAGQPEELETVTGSLCQFCDRYKSHTANHEVGYGRDSRIPLVPGSDK